MGDDGRVEVTITPTYSGCPAMDAIRQDVIAALDDAGFDDVDGAPGAGSGLDDRLDERSRQGEAARLRHRAARAIAAPDRSPLRLSLRCPQCGSASTHELSRFGSTACKSLWVCDDCREPFDHFKAH